MTLFADAGDFNALACGVFAVVQCVVLAHQALQLGKLADHS